ncbi:MAG: hypothetical protein ACRD59_14140 [Candidatus Acidiferrales bacterium]
MGGRARFLSVIACAMGILISAGSAAADTATLKCNSSRDQIWVYDSLSTFNVDARLKCGENVEVIARVQDYVKIRAQNGVEGYVPDASLSSLAPFEPYRDPARDVGLAAKQIQAKEIAQAAANAASLAPADVNYSAVSPRDRSAAVEFAKNMNKKAPSTSVSIAPADGFAELSPAPAPTSIEKSLPASAETEATDAPTPPTAISISHEAPAVDATTPRVVRPLAAPASSTGDSNELSNLRLESGVADLACRSYFSAYGLTPGQMKWIAQNRSKAFSSICPAPDPSKVDFVIIFTHDVDFFSGTMPELVHQSEGFSDFTPLAPIDTALIPESQFDKARREYVWIFQFEKGTFDPASFSPHRRYQFSKMETNSLGSKAGLKTVEDAFRFVASASR